MKTRLFSLIIAFCSVAMTLNAGIAHLLPTPRKVTVSQSAKSVTLTGSVRFATKPSERMKQVFSNLLAQNVGESDGLPLVNIVIGDDVLGDEANQEPTLAGFPSEAYKLVVGDGEISILARSETGVIRAIQTLAQMAEGDDGAIELEACTIEDWPAFKLRGWMHDVGRSFISVDELKRQIRLMGRFKVNTFHWHLTENQAWRFEVKQYPQLTNSSSMTRFVGKYYTQEECREVVALAAEYGIMVIPEIDMPGHSQAFERAMGHSMQTDDGMNELKNILDEVCEVFSDAPYIHIGADEQKITYPDFLKTITDYVHEKGQRVVVWNPISGVTINKNTGADMTQMWSTAGKKISGLPNIDCRYNYINHFDVFADLVGIYKSNIYYAQQGSDEVAGEITAVWNDRYVTAEQGIMRQNNVYASVLASTERAWKGGGSRYIEVGGTTLPNIGDEYDEFSDWERRFLFHKAHSLKDEAIPYVRQTNVRWRITDAFPNGGDATKTFPPETEGLKERYSLDGHTYSSRLATGAGIYLRHTWGTTVPALFPNPQTNHTAYAWTYVYSPSEQEAGALIEFQNYGRSEKDQAPENGKWDRKGSRLWLNDVEIKGPTWTNAGKSITNEIPLGNENFTARKPVKIKLLEGWNKVFLKLPYVSASGVRLNKWMFTFVITDTEGRDALDGLIYSPSKSMDGEQYTDDETFILRPSDEAASYWYTMCTPLRDGRYIQSNGVGQGLTGGADGTSHKAMWRFTQRTDGSYNIINRSDESFISPSASNNTQLKTSKNVPSKGWTLKDAATTGYFIITSGSVQVNQTNSGLGYKIYNWGDGTNTTDTGCQYLIQEADITDGIPFISSSEPSPICRNFIATAAKDLSGRPASAISPSINIIKGKKYINKQ